MLIGTDAAIFNALCSKGIYKRMNSLSAPAVVHRGVSASMVEGIKIKRIKLIMVPSGDALACTQSGNKNNVITEQLLNNIERAQRLIATVFSVIFGVFTMK
jgi:hypothetical protein